MSTRWCEIDSASHHITLALPVTGGTVIMHKDYSGGEGTPAAIAMCYVPVPYSELFRHKKTS